MIELNIPDMSCGHCAGKITETCKQVDRKAAVEIDLAAKRVRIESRQDRGEFDRALTEAGYPPGNA